MRLTIAALAAAGLTAAIAFAAAPAQGKELLVSSNSSEQAPLIVVLDLSGSMQDKDRNGMNKLIAAKAAVERIIRSQGQGSSVGVWGYPIDDDCGAGRFVVEPGNVGDVDNAVARVDSMSAAGNTPTGDALEAVVADLTGDGISEATIVLVSDGESNCSAPPCPVAERLAGSGFNLTVDAVGFEQSDTGRKELECVAAATGGRYFDADDGDQLAERIYDLTKPSITVEVSYSPQVQSGSSTQIGVKVTNPSSRDASEIKVNLAFSAEGQDSLLPGVIPPTYSLGGIPAGQSVHRSWRISTGVLGTAYGGNFAVTGWGSNVNAVRETGQFTVTADPPGVESVGDVLRGIRDGGDLVIVGDSFSSGEGTFDYLTDPSGAEDVCHRSLKTYGASMIEDAAERVHVIACSGAVTSNLFIPQHPGTTSTASKGQISELARTEAPGAVLLTFGGNDIGFKDIIVSCIMPLSCARSMLPYETALSIEGLVPTLTNTYEQVWSAVNEREDVKARDDRYAPVIVLAYPQIFHGASQGDCPFFEATEVDFANRLVVALNAAVKKAVTAARNDGYEVYFVADTQAAFLPDRTYCDGDASHVNGLIAPIDVQAYETPTQTELLLIFNEARVNESIHPKASGFAAETAALQAWSTRVEQVNPDIQKIEDARFDDLVRGLNETLNTQVADLQAQNNPAVTSGTSVTIKDARHAPFDTTVFMLHSTPVTIGSLTADESGVIDGQLLIPDFIPAGQHTLVAHGHDEDGDPVTTEMVVTVIDIPPWWLLLVAGLSMLAFVGAVAMVIVGVVRTRRRKEPAAAGPNGGTDPLPAGPEDGSG